MVAGAVQTECAADAPLSAVTSLRLADLTESLLSDLRRSLASLPEDPACAGEETANLLDIQSARQSLFESMLPLLQSRDMGAQRYLRANLASVKQGLGAEAETFATMVRRFDYEAAERLLLRILT
jgi:hypothetical protein